jgi:ribA/ribD-fused uncharacterized protein
VAAKNKKERGLPILISDFHKPGCEFYSNFYPAPVVFEGLLYACAENAYQAAKTLDPEKRREFQALRPGQAKRAGRKLILRLDWEQVKVDVMYQIVKDKFTRHRKLRELLLSSNEELLEGNTWGDTFWGVCRGVGQNHLGRILMRVRDELSDAYAKAEKLHRQQASEIETGMPVVILLSGGLVFQAWVAPTEDLAVEFAEAIVSAGHLNPEDNDLVVVRPARIAAPVSGAQFALDGERVWTWEPDEEV